jgi:hypothetical protein
MYVIDDCYVGNAASNADSAPAINMARKSGNRMIAANHPSRSLRTIVRI